ncbi:unnamed protein product [Rotaria sp. Silwood1]|nr:unnamed protein product [Rotaria sp. Silwood1]CAF3464722.1 unnamed protein product [Rotaria sp. Silwood1]
MSWRQILIGFLIFATLVIPIVQLSFGFHYIKQNNVCPIESDIMLLMAIGGVFEVIFFAASFGFVCAVTPSKYKKQKSKSTAADNTKGSNRASLILVGFITAILGACAIIFFVLIQIRVYANFNEAQWTVSDSPKYCLFTVFSSAFEPIRFQPSPRIVPSDNLQLTEQQIKSRQQLAHVNVIVTQAGRNVWDFEYPWSNKLCSCCTDMTQCCFAFCCLCCFECRLFKRAGENMWTSLAPGARYALRSKIRTAFRIEGDLCEDCCVSTCCPCCSVIQIERELHYQGL